MKKRLLIIFAGIAILMLMAGLLASCQPAVSAAANGNQQTGISVSGNGKVTVTPDVAVIQLGIQAQAKTVADAQSQAAKAMNDVMAALTGNGVTQKDIQTQYFNIQQTTTYDNVKQQQIITGYEVSNVVSAKVRDVTKAGSVIDAVTAAGGDLTRVNSIQFSLDNGVTLGKPISISENNTSAPQYAPVYAKAADSVSSTPISPGELDITLSVQVVYAIN